MQQVPGIYRIDGPTGKFYVGSAASLSRRWIEHKRDLKRGTHGNAHLQASWNKHGAEAFNITVLELVDDKALLLEREQYWIDTLDAVNCGYNILQVAGSRLGTEHSEETKRKQSEAHKGRKHGPMSQEQKDYYSKLYKGKTLSVETIQKMTASRIGSKRSEETKRRMSEAAKGKTFSEETRAKMAQAKIGKKDSEETKAKKLASANWRRLLNALEKHGMSLASREMNTSQI